MYKLLLFLFLINGVHHSFYAKNSSASAFVSIKRDTILKQETAIIDGVGYTAVSSFNKRFIHYDFCIKEKNDRIVYKNEGIEGFKFIDFNGDGYKDIILNLLVADSGEQSLLLYDPELKKFVSAGNCSNAERIPDTKYYYTYQDCCMGREWSSNLFYIADSKIINIGYIKYSDGYGLSFFKLDGKKKILIKKRIVRINGDTPVTTGPHIDFDLGKYWAKYWHSFAK